MNLANNSRQVPTSGISRKPRKQQKKKFEVKKSLAAAGEANAAYPQPEDG
jgi:hypothetical protein